MKIQVGGGSLALKIWTGGWGAWKSRKSRQERGVKKPRHPVGEGGGGVDFFWNNPLHIVFSMQVKYHSSLE